MLLFVVVAVVYVARLVGRRPRYRLGTGEIAPQCLKRALLIVLRRSMKSRMIGGVR